MGKLTAISAKNLSKPGRHGDGDGLYLNVAPSGSKSWVQRIVIGGRRRDLGLGPYPAVSLAVARTIAQTNRSAVAEGRDPAAEKREAREAGRKPASSIPTFAEAAARVIELRRPTWSNPKHAYQWQSTLQIYAFPLVGRKAVDAITAADVLEALTPVWTSKPETASRVRQRMETVMDWAVAQGYRLDNPAGRSLLKVLPKTQRLKEHHQALPYARVPGAVRQVRESTAGSSTKLAFEFLVLTAGRSGEVRAAHWTEVDWDSATWEIPASRMKARRPHRVPLSGRAMEILGQALELTDGQGLIFPAARSGKPASEMVFTALLRRLEIPAVPHGFRSSFRDWVIEQTPTPWAVAEAALAHNVGNSTEAAYMRSDLFDQRRALMDAWSAFVTGGTDTEGEMAEQSPDISNITEAPYMVRNLFDQSLELTEARAAYDAGWTDRTEGKTLEQARDVYLLDTLNGNIPGMPKYSDLPSHWRDTPEESSYASYSGFTDRLTFLAIYIDMAKKERWAWEGLRSLHRELLENNELIPDLLTWWVHHEFAKDNPPSTRGRPEEFDRDLRVSAVFTFLQSHGWPRMEAIDHIACLMHYESETIRSIIRKQEQRLRPAR